MTMMVALVGGQALPNLLPARFYRPSSMLLVYTQTTKEKYERLKTALEQETIIYGLETDAYNIVKITEVLNQKLDNPEFTTQALLFNLTGGTKEMALAAYQVALMRTSPIIYMESEGKRNRIFHYIWVKQQLQLASTDLLPDLVKLKDLFDIHLGVGNWKENGPPNNDGGLFEAALAEELRSYGYEVMAGIKAMKDQVEIDVALRFGNQFGIIEAKVGGLGRSLDGIKQLNNAVRHLGTYTKTFYAITVSSSQSHEVITNASQIQVISLQGYTLGTDRLTTSDAAELIAMVDKAMKR